MHDFSPDSKHCLICGSEKLRNFQAHASDTKNQSSINIIECRACNFAWQFPAVRTEKESIHYFESSYESAGKDGNEYFDPVKKRAMAELQVSFINDLSVENKTLLDIGCGSGIFAEKAADCGWKVTAIDPAFKIKDDKNNKNIEFIKGTIDDINNNLNFDVITLWDVIEHLPDPYEFLLKVRKHIDNTGWVVLETGNYKSYERIRDGLSHWIYQEDHRWYFSPEALQKLLRKTGFSVFIFPERVFRNWWRDDIINSWSHSNLKLLKRIIKNPRLLKKQLSDHFNLVKAKNWKLAALPIFTVAAQKPKD